MTEYYAVKSQRVVGRVYFLVRAQLDKEGLNYRQRKTMIPEIVIYQHRWMGGLTPNARMEAKRIAVPANISMEIL